LITHDIGGLFGDIILTNLHFETRMPIPEAGGPGRTLDIQVIERYALAAPFPLAFRATEALDGEFDAPIIASPAPLAVFPGAGGPARGSSASETHVLDGTTLPTLSAVKTSPAGDRETFSLARGPFFGVGLARERHHHIP
jgi:hypothetical protein